MEHIYIVPKSEGCCGNIQYDSSYFDGLRGIVKKKNFFSSFQIKKNLIGILLINYFEINYLFYVVKMCRYQKLNIVPKLRK